MSWHRGADVVPAGSAAVGGDRGAHRSSGSSAGWWLVRERIFFLICCEMMCRWHSRPAGRNGGTWDTKAGFLIFKPLPLPGNKCASLQNNNYKAWERIQGTQNPSVGIGALAEALLWLASCCLPDPAGRCPRCRGCGVFGGWMSSQGAKAGSETCIWGRAVIQKGENLFPLTLHPRE